MEAETFLRDLFSNITASSTRRSISFDATLRKVCVDGEERRLGSRQANLFEFLINNIGRVVEAEQAARHLFGAGGKGEVAALREHMHNLRKKIEVDPDNPRYLVSVPAQGYMLVS
jgi:DNA-binding response OmpR family regulator